MPNDDELNGGIDELETTPPEEATEDAADDADEDGDDNDSFFGS